MASTNSPTVHVAIETQCPFPPRFKNQTLRLLERYCRPSGAEGLYIVCSFAEELWNAAKAGSKEELLYTGDSADTHLENLSSLELYYAK